MSKNQRLMDRARRIDPLPPAAFRELAQSPDAQGTLKAILSTSPDDALTEMPAKGALRIARPRLQVGFAAAAALVLAAVGTVIFVPGGAATAEAKVRAAAAALGETESLRATIEQVYPNGEVVTFTGEFQGADGKQTATQVSSDGTPLSEWQIINIGDTEWMVTGEHVSSEHRSPQQRLSSFAEASSAVVEAALEGGDVEEVGTETVDGAESTHYRITPDARGRAALAQLKPGELAWFSLDLEAPAALDVMDVWVVDEIIHRIDIRFAPDFFLTSTSNRYFDFGANVVISPPPD